MFPAEIHSAPAGRAPETIPISALNQYLYCARRAYLIHAESIFVDNEHTTLGNLAHEAVDTPGYEHRAGWEILRALPLYSDTLGLSGKADLVEIRRADLDPSQIGGLSAPGLETNFRSQMAASGPSQISDLKSQMPRPVIAARPVEYKKGPARRWSNDHVQLCAQALCLEEMLGLRIASGLIFHAASAKRTEVVFDQSLRALTLATISNLRSQISNPRAPPAILTPRCDGCSLRPVCLPEATATPARRTSLYEPRDYT